MLKDDGRVQGHFRGLLVARNQEPQSGGEKQGQHLESKIVEHVALEELDHGNGSVCAPDSDLRCCVGSCKGESSRVSDSSSLFCAIEVGRVTGRSEERRVGQKSTEER